MVRQRGWLITGKQVCTVTLGVIIMFVLYILYSHITFAGNDEVIGHANNNMLDPSKVRGKSGAETIHTVLHKITPRGKNFHWVDQTKADNFTVRVSQYNTAIHELRLKIVSTRENSEWKEAIDPSPQVLWCNSDDFMFKVQAYDQIQTVVLPWLLSNGKRTTENKDISWSSLTDHHNVLTQVYYKWAATEPLCRYIKTEGFTKARYDAVYNKTCSTDINATLIPTSLDVVYFYGKPINPRDYWPNNGNSYPNYFYNELPDRLMYIHIIQDAVITMFGDVHSGNLKLIPYGCSQDRVPDLPPNVNKSPIWNEVFMITQYWGDQFFHKMLEGFPRIAPYIEFLQRNKHIKIHVAEKRGYTRAILKFLGFNPERIISETARAKIVYLPQATPCGFMQVHELQILSKLYRDKIRLFGLGARNLLILVQRSGSRHFHKKDEMAFVVEKTATEFGLEYYLFPDNPTPPMEQTMQAFNQAVMVIAPHGAGLANMVYSEPGTFIIEGVCNPPHVNMCFQWTAHILGHRYHGIPSKTGCEDRIVIEPSLVDIIMRMYLQQINKIGLKNVFSKV